ncbi:hypothetical protein C6Y01_09955 [Bacillus sp. NMCC46]|uniref:hypothetical protein n=1 Tax=Bacillus sp. NMCC46 TaxID=2108538 RepID=UPI000D03C3B6|nr:hypothetical protein [Bacillus sp. NMCC46]PRS42943.1 hypothetical protein C6Y01_09955 [Bacillus sp. NMCC46]
MHIYYFDENFKYQGEDVISDYEEIPKNATDVRPKKGLYLPEYDADKREWFESASKEYIESLQPTPQPSKIDLMEKQVAELYYLFALGGDPS